MSAVRPEGLREVKKRRTRDALEAAAWRLFARNGFDETTVEDIAAAVDVAPRTFFRYFETKDAVLYGNWREGLAVFCEQLRQRPTDEPPLVSLSACATDVIDRMVDDSVELLQRSRIAAGSATFGRYRHEVMQPTTVEAIAEVLAERLGVDIDLDLRPRLLAGVVAVVTDTASAAWVAGGGRQPVTELVEQAFAELGIPVAARHS